MKNILWTSACIATLAFQVTAQEQHGAAADNRSESKVEPTIVERGPHHRVWERRTVQVMPNGRSITNRSSYTELATGMHYQKDGQWLESKEEIELFDGAAAALQGQHKAVFSQNINTRGGILVIAPDGSRQSSHVIGLAYTDAASGQSVLIAGPQDSIGEVGGNQVHYRNAFDGGFRADMRYTYTRGGFEQDVVIRESLPSPEQFGFDPETTRLEVWTEFIESGDPVKSVTALKTLDDPALRQEMADPDLTDEMLGFGAMWIGRGNAFPIEQNGAERDGGATPVGKSWIMLEGRRFLIEKVDYRDVEAQLADLPKSASVAKPRTNLQQAGRGRNSRLGLLAGLNSPERSKGEIGVTPMRMASAMPTEKGFVLDYVLTSSQTNATFHADKTYYLSGTVSLSGTNSFEGGAVFKYTNNASLGLININSYLNWRATPYRPVIFTSKDDDTVGETINGSTGVPTNYYGKPALYIVAGGNMTLENLRFSWAKQAIEVVGTTIALLNVQLVKCDGGASFSSGGASLRNALFSGIRTNLHLYQGTFNLQNVTFNDSLYLTTLASNNSATLTITNCVFANITNLYPYAPSQLSAGYNGFHRSTTFGSTTFTNTAFPFQTFGAAGYYLTTNSPYRNVATTNVDSTLLSYLRKQTTYPPLLYGSGALFTNSLTLSVQAQRDVDDPDLGYHYDPLDYVFSGLYLTNATITAQAGVAIGIRTPFNTGLGLLGGANFYCEGTPDNLNRIVRYNTVQEQSNTNWTEYANNWPYGIVTAWSTTTTPPQVRVRFTEFSVLGTPSMYHFYGYSADAGSHDFRDCQFHAGYFWTESPTLNVTNCLFNRAWIGLAESSPLDVTFLNCTFVGSDMMLANAGASTWTFKNNLFDGTTNSYVDGTFTHGYNAYTTNATRLTPTNANDIPLSVTNISYAKGLLGHFYLPTNLTSHSPLFNTGSVSAASVGLYHYTTTTNQVKETNSTVDIGFHYVAANSLGQPVDLDLDGIPDYAEDKNGNGTLDSGETVFHDPVLFLADVLDYIKGSPPKRLDTNAVAYDSDTSSLGGGLLKATISSGADANDRLAVRHEGTNAAQIAVSSTNLLYGNLLFANFTGGSGTTPLTINFNTNASNAAVQALARNLTFNNVSNITVASTRTVQFLLTDGQGGTNSSQVMTINVICPQAVDVMLVLDASNSMTNHFPQAKAAASNFVSRMDFSVDRAGLVSFSENATLEMVLTNSATAVQNKINGLTNTSGTRLKPPIDLARTNLLGSTTNVLRLMLILSDGELFGETENAVKTAAQQAADAGIRIITIGFYTGETNYLGGFDWVGGTNLLRQIASSPQDYYFTPTSAQMQSNFVAVAQGLCRGVPEVALTNPAPSAIFYGPTNILLEADAFNDSSVVKVEFFEGGLKLGEDLVGPHYGFTWSNVVAGSYGLYARAVNNYGAEAFSSVINISVRQGPSVYVVSPPANATNPAPYSLTLSAVAQDPDGYITKVEYFTNSVKLGESTISPYTLQWTNVSGVGAPGTQYTLTTKATDNHGLTNWAPSITLTVTNQPPTVSITNPAANTTNALGEPVVIQATAQDVDGQITKVQFFWGINFTNMLFEDTVAPYALIWTNAPSGMVILQARTFDNSGLTGLSTLVTNYVQSCSARPAMTSFTLSTNSVLGGKNITGTISLASGALSGGQPISLVSTSLSVVLPGSVLVPEGSVSLTVPITTISGEATNIATIVASASATNFITNTLTVIPGSGVFDTGGTNPSSGILTTNLNVISTNDLVRAIVGPEVVFSDVQYYGASHAAGVFGGGRGIVGFESGIALSSGDISNLCGSNTSYIAAEWNFLPGDTNLNSLVSPYTTKDATVLMFKFVPVGEFVTWEYVFASEEYNDFVGSPYNDVFGFFLNGTNVALLPDGVTAVAVNNINNGNFIAGNSYAPKPPRNPQFYRDNSNGGIGGNPTTAPILTQMDGLTTVLRVTARVIPGTVNEIKLAIADTEDYDLDSIVVIRAGSFRTGGKVIYTREDSQQKDYSDINLMATNRLVISDQNATVDLNSVVGVVQSARMERTGSFQFTPGNRFDLRQGVRFVSAQTNDSFGPASFDLDNSTSPASYNLAWSLPTEAFPAIESGFGHGFSFSLIDQIASLCGGSHQVSDTPHGTWPTNKNILSILVSGRRDIAQGRCQDFALEGTNAPLNGSWDVTLDSEIVASSGRPNGWSVELDYTVYGGVNICVPEQAPLAPAYEVRVRNGQSRASGIFSVVAGGSRNGAPVMYPLAISKLTVTNQTQVTVTVSLDAPAPPHGAYVTLRSEGLINTNIPAVVVIPSGERSGTATFTQTTATNGTLGLLASFNGYRKTSVGVTNNPGSAPGTPTGLTAVTNGQVVNVDWTAVAAATGYNIRRSNSVSTVWESLFLDLSTNHFVDANVFAGITYYYTVSATNRWGQSSESTKASVLVPFQGAVAAPRIIPFGGMANDSVSVLVTNYYSGTTNYYTTDGSLPTTSSASFTNAGVLVLTSNATVRAFAVNPGFSQASRIVSANFVVVVPTEIVCGNDLTNSLSLTNAYSVVRGPGFFGKRFSFTPTKGDLVTISASSTNFDTVLYLIEQGTNLVASNDDYIMGSTDSRIVFNARGNGPLVIEVTSFAKEELGAFNLMLNCEPVAEINVLTNAYPTITSTSASLPNYGTIDFGSTNTAGTITRYLTITNSGNTNLSISGIAILPATASSFTVTNSSLSIPANGITNLSIKLQSAVDGLFNAYLIFSSNDATNDTGVSENPYSVKLRGRIGAAPTNPVPVISIKTPTNGQQMLAGTSFNITTAIAPTQDLARVEFFLGVLSLGEVTNAPWTNFNWTATVEDCACGLRAEATDKYGQVGVSPEVFFSVTNPATPWLPGIRVDGPAPIPYKVHGQTQFMPPVIQDGFLAVTGAVYQVQGALTNPASYRILITTPDGKVVRQTGWLTATQTTAFALYTNDLTTVRNGVYDLQVVVRSTHGITSEVVRFILESNLKIGQFSFSEQDLVIPVNGLPLTVVRTYNSLNPSVGDFGYSWTYAINDVELALDEARINKPPLFEEDATSDDGTFSLRVGGGRNVTLTLPDGRRTTFVYYEEAGSCNTGDGFSLCAFPRYQAAPGVNASLRAVDAYGFDNNGYDTLTASWRSGGGANTSYENFDFAGFILTTQDGTEFYIKREFMGAFEFLGGSEEGEDGDTFGDDFYAETYGRGKVVQIKQRSGDIIRINNDLIVNGTNRFGIDHFNASNQLTRSIFFERDSQGRVSAIRDPISGSNGTAVVKYEYDSAGNLSKVLKLVDRTTQAYLTNSYLYENAQYPHYVTKIVDARGQPAARQLYDDQGRLTGIIDASGRTNRFEHDLAARAETVFDREGNKTIHVYDARGNVISTTDALDHTTQRVYDTNNYIIRETDSLNNTTSYAYDEKGNQTAITNALGQVTRLAYNNFSQVLTMVDPLGHGVTNTYDPQGNLSTTVDALGNATTLLYDSLGRLVSQRDASGTITTNRYDSMGNLTNVITAGSGGASNFTSYSFDVNGNRTNEVSVRTLPGGTKQSATNSFLYDGQNRVVTTLDAAGSSSRTIYNQIGQVAATVNARNVTNLMVYDERGLSVSNIVAWGLAEQAVETTGYDGNARRTLATNRLGWVTQFVYDKASRLVQTIHPDNTTNTTVYDDAGRVRQTVDARGGSTRFGFDAVGRRVAVTNALEQASYSTFDAAGNLILSADAAGRFVEFEHDALNRQVRTLFMSSVIGQSRPVQTVGLDTLGRAVARTNEAGVVTRMGYDALGRMTAVTNAWGTSDATWATYAFDERGNQTNQVDALGRRTSFEFDVLGRRLRRVLPNGQWEGFAYDVVGNLLRHTNFNGQIITNLFDAQNRLLSRWHGSTNLESYTYNAAGQRTARTDASGSYSWVYDVRGRVRTNTTPVGVLYYNYDANGNLTNLQSSTAGGVSLTYQYDLLNRLTNVIDQGLSGTKNTAYRFDAIGNLAALQYPNGVRGEWQYDARNRLTNQTWKGNASTLASFSYQLAVAGNRTSLSDSVNGTNRTFSWGYDRLYRLTNETITGATPTGTISYRLDAVGNRTNRTSGIAGILTTNNYFDANDWLDADSTTNNGSAWFDANGNTRTNLGGTATTLLYDWANRLTNANNGAVVITYDADGNRVKKVAGGITTLYLVSTINPSGYAQVMEELTVTGTTNLSQAYTYGLDLISQREGSMVYFFGTDGLGSTRLLTDLSGGIANTFAYDAFGTLIASNGPPQTAYLFAGEQFDFDLGIYYNRARLFDPNVGRFTTQDGDGFGDQRKLKSLHLYNYAEGDPANNIDPSGHEIESILAVVNITSIGFNLASPRGASSAAAFIDRSRPLTQGEIDMSKSIFGSKIDYSKPKVYNRPWIAQSRYTAVTPNGNIYMRGDGTSVGDAGGPYRKDFSVEPNEYLRAVFIHEMTHVWQYQDGAWVKTRAAINRKYSYDYATLGTKDFKKYGLEQQASIVEDFYLIQSGFPIQDQNGNPVQNPPTLQSYQKVTSPYFP